MSRVAPVPPAHMSASANPVAEALRATRGFWVHIAVFSACVNVLMLTGSLYMLQVYDRVLTSRSIPTLIGLSLLALAAFGLQGLLDSARLKILGRIGALVDARLAPLALGATMRFPLMGMRPVEAMQPARDLDALRAFLGGLGPTAIIDMPFMPLFLGACFVLHPWLGWLAVLGAVFILLLTFMIERRTQKASLQLIRSAGERSALLEAGRRNAEAIAGLGMTEAYTARFAGAHTRYVGDNLALAETTGRLGALARVFRYVLQSAVLGLGAYLAVKGQMSAGAMIAASILSSRALAPIELAVAHWKGFVAARQAHARLSRLLPLVSAQDKTLALPIPERILQVTDLTVVAPGTARIILQNVSLQLKAGQGLGLIGPSGSGKSTLARAIAGVWPAVQGEIRLDGAKTNQWSQTALGAAIGYLPQDVELFEGTIAENIARFAQPVPDDEVLAAAAAAGAHQMIVDLPEGYDTRLGEGGASLSGGQRQRIALARALFGNPFLLVLDEPNANLDSAGDDALNVAIRTARARGAIVIVITHRQSGLAAVDLVGAIENGRLVALGPRDEILAKGMRPPQPVTARFAQLPAVARDGARKSGGAS